ncbi:putative F-box protein At3g10240 [Impatiens glandulifera]|uniref:putative F-box protein At3g10240 n=1 Tax=Impatiens glandulifera TaxID=253017 RepID=UPI001FB1814A|nr:putative F-box protein At3g10240 [Impatiens glandulifera]
MDTRSNQSLSTEKKRMVDNTQISLLCEDLLLEILKRLPAKDVFQCRSVCKEWNFLLRTPHFISLHYNHSSQINNVSSSSSSHFILLRLVKSVPYSLGKKVLTFFTIKKTNNQLVATIDKEVNLSSILSSLRFPSNVGFPSLPKQSDMDDMPLFCPFDGLICFGYGWHVILYNPSTRESQLLYYEPHFSRLEIGFRLRILDVWFESSVKQHYKVFMMVLWNDCCKIDTYDSTVNTWRLSKAIFGMAYRYTSLLLNGIIHFYMKKDSGSVIVTFDARLETFGELEFPPCYADYNKDSRLFSFCGNLSFLKPGTMMDDNSICCEIWVMTEYGMNDSWRKIYSIPIGGFTVSLFLGYLFRPLKFWKNMEGHDELLLKTTNNKILVLNLHMQKFTYLELDRDIIKVSKIVSNNVESLLSLK